LGDYLVEEDRGAIIALVMVPHSFQSDRRGVKESQPHLEALLTREEERVIDEIFPMMTIPKAK